jgi:hypothetical protein
VRVGEEPRWACGEEPPPPPEGSEGGAKARGEGDEQTSGVGE